MKRKVLKLIIILILVIAVWAIMRFVIGGSEDTWICVDGEWVKHGVPSAPMPTELCVGKKTCVNDEDCIVFGQDGDCNCGCFNKSHNWKREGDCFCMAPRSCKCVEGVCEAVFEAGEENSDVVVFLPEPNQIITSPLTIEGKAKGSWFFEADFPIVLVNWDGLIIGEGLAMAQSEWMTEDFVEFKAVIEFEKPDYGERGTLIFRKDNPSGLPEHDDAFEVLILFE